MAYFRSIWVLVKQIKKARKNLRVFDDELEKNMMFLSLLCFVFYADVSSSHWRAQRT
jgi:hypothetical protein